MRLREPARRIGMILVITVHRINASDGVLNRAEGEKAFSRWQMFAESGVLRDDWATGCQVASAAITEPSALGCHIAALGKSELGFRMLDKLAVGGGCGGHLARVHQVPAATRNGFQVARLVRVDRQGKKKFLVRVARELDYFPKRVGLLPIERSLVLDR